MNRIRPLPFALLAALCASPLANAGEAAPGSITVTTEAVPPPKPGPSDGAMRAMPHGAPLDLDARAPAGVAAPPAGTRPAQWAEWKVGGKAVTVAFVRGEGDALTVYADANGDKKFDAAEAVAMSLAPAGNRGPAAPKTWELEAWKVGDAKAALVASEAVAGLSGRLVFKPSTGAKDISKPLPFTDAKPASVSKAEGLGERVRWASTVVGEKAIVVALARGSGYEARLAVDANGDGELSAAETHAVTGKPARRGAPSGPVETKVTWEFGPVTVENLDVRVVVSDAVADLRANVVATATRKGTVDVDGVSHALFLVDGDFDGKIGSEDDFWWFGKARAPDPKDRKNSLGYATMFEATEASFGGGKAWRLQSVGTDGTATVVPAPAVDVEAYFHRRGERVNAKRWFPRFDLEAPVFSEDQKLGPPRPKAPKAPSWHHVIDFDEAIAFAKKEKKPLLVDFEADWCVWCKRVDYYTYGDAEVAALLSKFTLVKLNVDFDEDRSFDGFKFGGLPAIAAFDSAGKPVRFTSSFPGEKGEEESREEDKIPGWSKPERFALHLKNLYAAWEKTRPTTGGN